MRVTQKKYIFAFLNLIIKNSRLKIYEYIISKRTFENILQYFRLINSQRRRGALIENCHVLEHCTITVPLSFRDRGIDCAGLICHAAD